MDLKNKTIIVTGVAKIGQRVAEDLKAKGANLVMTYLGSPLEQVKNLGIHVEADVSKQKDVEKVIRVAKKEFGRIDGLVHMAAIYKKTEWQNLTEKSLDENYNIIAKSTFLFGKLLGDEMRHNEGDVNPIRNNPPTGSLLPQTPLEPSSLTGRGAGVISNGVKGKMIFFADWSVLTRPYKDYLPYNAAKSMVVGLTKSFAKELAPGILVNAIAPGPIMRPTDLTDEENEEVLAGTLLKRWGGNEEISKGVLYLLESDFITGQVLTIDGGRTIT